MKYYLKQFFISFLLGSTLLLWGLLFKFTNEEIMLATIAVGVLQYTMFGARE